MLGAANSSSDAMGQALCLPALATLGKDFSPHFRFLPIREVQKPASNQNHQNTQQSPLNLMAGTLRKPRCTKSHPGAATDRYSRCPGTSGIPSDTEHVAGPALVGRTHGAATSTESSAQPAPWAQVQCGSCRSPVLASTGTAPTINPQTGLERLGRALITPGSLQPN